MASALSLIAAMGDLMPPTALAGLFAAMGGLILTMSTGIGSGVAIPHVRISGILKPAVGVGISKEGIAFDTLDNRGEKSINLDARPSDAIALALGQSAPIYVSRRVLDEVAETGTIDGGGAGGDEKDG